MSPKPTLTAIIIAHCDFPEDDSPAISVIPDPTGRPPKSPNKASREEQPVEKDSLLASSDPTLWIGDPPRSGIPIVRYSIFNAKFGSGHLHDRTGPQNVPLPIRDFVVYQKICNLSSPS